MLRAAAEHALMHLSTSRNLSSSPHQYRTLCMPQNLPRSAIVGLCDQSFHLSARDGRLHSSTLCAPSQVAGSRAHNTHHSRVSAKVITSTTNRRERLRYHLLTCAQLRPGSPKRRGRLDYQQPGCNTCCSTDSRRTWSCRSGAQSQLFWCMSSMTNSTMTAHLNATCRPYLHPAMACPQVVGLDASSAESRTDLLIIVLSAVLLLTGLQWLALKPIVKEPVSRSSQCGKDAALQCLHPETTLAVSQVALEGKLVDYQHSALSDSAAQELEWCGQMRNASSRGPLVTANLPHDSFLDVRPGLGEHYKPPGVEH